MRIAILGGGITGLTAGYYLAKKGYKVTLFEKETNLGGLASGFSPPAGGWDWPLERAYHHLFANDYDILNFAKEVGFNRVKLGSRKIFFQEPVTASLYENAKFKMQSSKLQFKTSSFAKASVDKQNFSIYPLDTPVDFLQFPLLSLPQKMLAGVTLASLKLSPYLSLYERQTAEELLKKTMGKEVWKILWQELFRKKFGKYAGNILASFIWARIKKRTKQLGYMEGGFQTFIDYLEEKNNELGVIIRKGVAVESIQKTPLRPSTPSTTLGNSPLRTSQGQGGGFIINGERFDAIVSTLPTAIMVKITQKLFPKNYLAKFEKLHYLHAVNLIIESTMPLFENEYWINVCSNKLPFMVLVQHTNFIDKKHYGGNHILYVGNYIDHDDKLLKMEKEEILDYFLPYLKQINPSYTLHVTRSMVFKAPFAQPIFDKDFIANKPDFETPLKNFFIANLDMTYPYDRGTNYAVKLGKNVAEKI